MRPRFPQLLVILLALSLLAVAAAAASAAAPAWLSYRHDAAGTGIDPDSPAAAAVTPAQAWQTPQLDGAIYGQPLVYGSAVFVATENDTIYKLDAATGAVVWSTHLATPQPSSAAMCGNITPNVGITSTPVIDPATNRIYAVGAVTGADGAFHHDLFAVDLTTGQQAPGFPIGADPPALPGADVVNQLQRTGLTLAGGRILIGYGGNSGDCSTYWGWLVSAPESGQGGLGTPFQVNKDFSPGEGAIWGGGSAPTVDAAGNVYLATGNGADANTTSDPEFGNAVVKLTTSATVLDWWAPSNWAAENKADQDLGSSNPALLPGGFLFEAGKDGSAYLLNGAKLGHVSAPTQMLAGFCSDVSDGGDVFDPANSTIYAPCSGPGSPGLRAVTFTGGSSPSIAVKAGFTAPAGATGPPIIAAGLVWSANQGGTLFALNPATGAATHQFTIPENEVAGGSVNDFQSPGAGGGRLFVASGDQVTAFTIATAPAPSATSTTLASSANPGVTGTAVALTAGVSPVPDAGTVSFTDGGAPIAGCTDVAVSPVSGGSAVCRATALAAGTHAITATYSGDPFYTGSASAALSEQVSAPPPPTTKPAGGGKTGPLAHVIKRASLKPTRFRAGHTTTLRIKLGQLATVKITVKRARPAHVGASGCSLKAHHGKRCTVWKPVMRQMDIGHKGHNRLELAVSRLPHGNYEAVIHASKKGHNSPTVTLRFTILRRPHHHKHKQRSRAGGG